MVARQQVAQPNLKPTIMVLGSLLAVAATGFGFIGTPILWVALLMAGWSAQPPILSGKKDGGGRPTPAHPGEVAQMSKYRFWSDIRWRLLVPTGDWFPLTIGRWWPLASWFGAVWAGLFVYKVIPTSNTMNTEALAGLANVTPTVNGLFLFICLAQIAASRRRSMTAGDECPGVRLDSFIAVMKKPGLAFELKALGGTVAGVLAGFIGDNLYLLGVPGTHPSGVNLWLYVFTVPFGFIAAVYKDWDEEALGHWRGVAAARLEWEPRWPQLKIDPAPYVTDRKRLGPASMDTFQAAGSIPASTFTAPLMLGKIAPILGTGTRLAALEHPGVDSQGQPLQGTTHPLDFDLISWPVDQLPDLMTETDPEIVREYVRSAMSWAAPQMGLLSAVLNEIQKISVEGSPVVYVTTWSHPTGGHAATIRAARGTLANELQAHVLVDDQQSLVFFGQLDGELELDPEFGVTAEQIKNLQIEDEWNKRWYEVQKQGVNPPVIEHGLYKTAELADGTVIHMQPFMTRQGIEPDEFFAHSDKLSTTLDQASFVNVTGWTKGAGKRAGERHPQAFCVYWNDFGRHVAARPDELRPAPGDAPKWVLASHINKAFTAARLARPEVVSAKCFTAPESRTHIWEVSLRLYGGVTLADVRGMANKIRTAMGTEWMRVAATEDGCKIVCGAQPRKVKLNRPRDAAYLTSLDWEQAWLDSKVTGVASQTPKLLSVGNLPHNEQVEVLEFELPPGLDVTAVKAARTKLETATSNMFIEVRRGDKANQVTVLACEINPMPLMVGMDFDAIDASDGIPFATGVEGEPVVFDPSSSPHALLAGVTGAGKVTSLTTRIPVPISGRFPDGWATVGTLDYGDLVYTPAGTVTPIVGFSQISVEPVYEVEFSDGQIVEAGAEHLWKVSSASSRAGHTPGNKNRRNSPQAAARAKKVADLRALAAATGPGLVAPLSDIASIAKAGLSLVHRTAPRELAVDQLIPTGKKSRTFDLDSVLDVYSVGLKVSGYPVDQGSMDRLADLYADPTVRQIAGAIVGADPTREQRHSVKARMKSQNIPTTGFAQTEQVMACYPVDEMLFLLADSYESSMRDLQPLESVRTTREMLSSLIDEGRNARHNWAVRVAEGIRGVEADLAVDPYVMGAWLGDGSTWHTSGITSEDPFIIDQTGLEVHRVEIKPDNAASTYHLVGLKASLEAAGFPARPGAGKCADKYIPANYLRASKGQRLAVLQGLMDTDGTVDEAGSCGLSLSDRHLAGDALELIRSLGIKASISWDQPASYVDKDGNRVACKNRHRIHFTTNEQVFRLPRKARRLKAEVRSTQDWNYVVDIRVRGEEPMRCISIADAEHMYLTDQFIPTHNSVLAQAFVYGFATKGAEIYIIDPMKGAADFKFVEDYAKGIATTTAEAAGTLKLIYAEVVRRKNLNAEAGVGSINDLESPPPPLVVMIDEFTSLMGQSPVPKPNDDPEMDSERDAIIADNANRATIGIITGKLAREARSAGVTLLLGTQKLSAKLLDSVPGGGDLKTNLARVLLGKTSSGDRMSALRAFDEAPPMGDSIPKGRGLWEPLTHSAVMIQAWYAPQAELVENLRARRPALPLEERVDMSQFEIEEANQVAYTSPAAGQEEETTEHAEVSLDELDAMLAELDAEDPDQTASDTAPFDQTASDQTVLEEVQGQDDGWPEPAPEPEPTQSPVSAEPFELSQIDWSGWDSVPSQYGFPRIDAVLAWLEINPQITDVEWAEPLLTPALTETARAAFAESGVTLHSPQATLVTEVPNEFADTQGFALPSVDKSRLPDGFDF